MDQSGWHVKTPIFADYDQAELDAQYDNQRACPAFADTLAMARQMSLDAAALPGERNVRWGNDARESLDIYRPKSSLPEDRKLAPTVVYVHGGGWFLLDKESSAFAAPSITEDGCMFVALGFHTVATVDFSTMVERVRAGIAWVIQNISAYGGDSDRVVLVGHSSGTHLVTQCLAMDGVAGALLVSGLCDLEPVRLSYRNTRLRLGATDVSRYSLVHNTLPISAWVSVVAAEDDTTEFRRQADDMAAYLRARGNLRESYTVNGKHHFDVILDLVDSSSRLFRTLRDLVHKRDKRSEPDLPPI